VDILNSRLYRVLEVLTNIFFLNLLWLVMCLPIVTIFPATAAMFGVVREWTKEREPGIFGAFFSFFKENFRQSVWIGVLWTLLGFFLATDFVLIGQMDSVLRIPLFLVMVFCGVLYVLTSLYLFPVMVNYHASWLNVVRTSLFLSIGHPFTTVKCLLVIGAVLFVLNVLSIAGLMMVGSIAAYAIYRFCDPAFQSVALARNEPNRVRKQESERDV
jgi:uncharacterized membrane protein YesL